MISVVVIGKNEGERLAACLKSIQTALNVLAHEVVYVDSCSTDQSLQTAKTLGARCFLLAERQTTAGLGRFVGAKEARGEYLLFLNNDTEMIGSDCIKEMLSYCMREDVGAVGARMYYEDGTLQHGGVIIGLGGVAGHAFLGIDGDSPGYFARAQVVHDLSAVTAACMMMKKRVYEEVGGFDSKFAVAFNDVDLCLKIRKAGYLIVYDPYAELIHYESKSRGYEDTEEKIERFHGEVNLFQTRWKDFLKKGDPYYSPNLTLDHNDFGLNHLAKVERR